MKTRELRGFSFDPHSLHFIGFRPNSRALRRNQGRKLDGASGARPLRAKRIATALLAPSDLKYRPPLAFSTQPGRRGADGSAPKTLSGALCTVKAGMHFPAERCTTRSGS
jgi:hypothetical protein